MIDPDKIPTGPQMYKPFYDSVSSMMNSAFPNSRAAYNENAANISDAVSQGNYGAAVGQTLRGVASQAVGLGKDVVQPLAPVGKGMVNAASTLITGSNEPVFGQPPAPGDAPALRTPVTSMQADRNSVTTSSTVKTPATDRLPIPADASIQRQMEIANQNVRNARAGQFGNIQVTNDNGRVSLSQIAGGSAPQSTGGRWEDGQAYKDANARLDTYRSQKAEEARAQQVARAQAAERRAADRAARDAYERNEAARADFMSKMETKIKTMPGLSDRQRLNAYMSIATVAGQMYNNNASIYSADGRAGQASANNMILEGMRQADPNRKASTAATEAQTAGTKAQNSRNQTLEALIASASDPKLTDAERGPLLERIALMGGGKLFDTKITPPVRTTNALGESEVVPGNIVQSNAATGKTDIQLIGSQGGAQAAPPKPTEGMTRRHPGTGVTEKFIGGKWVVQK